MSEPVNPTELVTTIAKPRLTVALIISFVVHIVLLILLSISFLGDCFHYKTIHPKVAIKAEKKAAEEAAEKKRREDMIKTAELKAKEAKEAEEKEAAGKDGKAAGKAAPKAAADKKGAAAKSGASVEDKQKKAVEELENQKLDPSKAKGSVEDGLSL